MTIKDGINKISGIILISIISVTIIGYVLELEAQFPLTLNNLLYIAGPVFLVWFGTRKNGCGSCNQQSCSISPSESNVRESQNPDNHQN